MRTDKYDDHEVLICAGRRPPDGVICRNPLGIRFVGLVVIMHRKRRWVGIPLTIQCEICGTIWRDSELGALIDEGVAAGSAGLG